MASTDLTYLPGGALERRQAKQTARQLEVARFDGLQAAAQFESVGQAAFTGLSMLGGLAAVEAQVADAHPGSELRARAIVDAYTGFVCSSIAMLSTRR